MQGRTETHIYTSPPGAAPGAAHFWARPEVGMTWGFMTKTVSPGRGFIVHPQVGPSPPPCPGYPIVYTKLGQGQGCHVRSLPG